MATWEDVARIAGALPEAAEEPMYGQRAWKVRGKGFVWARPLRGPDLDALGDAAPQGPILGARVEHEGVKQALIADDPDVFFTIPHFDGYSAILIQLDRITPDVLEEIVVEAWLLRAPKRLAKAHLESLPG